MDDWEDLLKISTKNNSDSTKWTILGVEEVAACLIHRFGSVSVLHRDLIPDDKPHGSDKISEVPLFCDGAITVVICCRTRWGKKAKMY